MHIAPALCIVLLITAWYAPVLADEPAPDYDAMILAGLENQTVTDEIDRVLEDEDTLLAFTIAPGTCRITPCEDFIEAMDILKTLAAEKADWAYIEFTKGDFNAWAPYASPLPAP